MSLPSTPTVRSAEPVRRSVGNRWRYFGRPPRLMGIDVARGLAIFGMIGAHVGISWMVAGPDGPDLAAIVQGRSSILFAVVAGISVALATGREQLPRGEALRSARLRMAGRALVVLALGLALEMLGSGIAVILPIYGILFLILIPFLGLRRRTLALTAAAIAVAGPTVVALLRAMTLSGAGIPQGIGGTAVDFLISGSYPLTVWLPLVLAGMALGRLRLDRRRTAAVLFGSGVGLAAFGYGLGDAFNGTVRGWLSGWGSVSSSASALSSSGASSLVASSSSMGPDGRGYLKRLSEVDLGAALSQAWGVAPHSGGTWEIIGSGGFALAVVGACLLLARPLRALLVPVAAVGSMPLTAYTAHVVSFAVLISPLGLAPDLSSWDGDPAVSGCFWIGCVVVLLAGCTMWALSRGRGPLESVTANVARRVDLPAGSGAR
ncbi:heparan-alpha-glucosaminide N-acetyltransferase domain-containing protein [Microbacterium sp. NE2HP2]|uniref:heparan-alpha-glucosaminide N-acetyltransferase domain-containing protein n=1 Tax=Microbacterium plantarum TaxID=1816425 RepID=UPI0023672CFF|nr:heparan-alpha-glucosaminide N-acetyltransferase domain-containing protein [Microbacterium plantarum]MDD7943258.1 heparan-alpha-glucosaminide N-acetyltransferase domain-containing protein [Microbacterium plantarum]